jgi:hypothetical protein
MIAMSNATEEFAKKLLSLFAGEGIECVKYALGTRAHTITLPPLSHSVK